MLATLHFGLYLALLQSIALIITTAFILVQTPITRFLFNLDKSLRKQLLLGIFFGFIAIAGTYLGEPVNGAIANIRDIGAISGGLFGGPLVGFIAGLIGGVHRYSLHGFTALPCALATIINGTVAGFLYKFRKEDVFNPFKGMIFALGAETFHMILVLLLAKPYSAALSLINLISGPMILSNGIGVGMFLLVIKAAFREKEILTALTAEKVLKITEKTLPVLSNGLTFETANITARIILSNTNLDAVGITDTEKILAFCGAGEDHHRVGDVFHTKSTKEAIKSGEIVMMYSHEQVGCNVKNCPLESGIVVPMKSPDGEVFGVLKLYRVKRYAISLLDREIAKGLADILSMQIQLNKIEKEKKLRMVSQMRALQARINPHFLFNALNTIRYMVRINPEKAYDLLLKLSVILRETIDSGENFIPLKKEIEFVKAYIDIEKGRFGDRLEIDFDISCNTERITVPSLIIQPIVENAIKHAFYPELKKLKIKITVFIRFNMLYVIISDNGKGMSKEKLKEVLNGSENRSVGIRNVRERLENLYGNNYQFKITSHPKKGTKVIIGLPQEGVKKWLLERLSLTTKSQQGKK